MQECNKVPGNLQFTKNNLEFETVLIVFFELAKKSREKTPVQSLAYHCRSSANLQFVFVHFYSAAALAHWCVWEKDEALVEIITDSHQGTICRDFRIYPAFAGIWRSKILFPKNQSDRARVKSSNHHSVHFYPEYSPGWVFTGHVPKSLLPTDSL